MSKVEIDIKNGKTETLELNWANSTVLIWETLTLASPSWYQGPAGMQYKAETNRKTLTTDTFGKPIQLDHETSKIHLKICSKLLLFEAS